MSARWTLRAATAAEHERLDAAFARFDLADAAHYRAFLQAHRRALPALEAAVAVSGAAWAGWSPRAEPLEADLRALGAEPETAEAPVPPLTPAQAWGVQYVLEGSRLGGRLLAQRLAPDAPRNYLANAQPAGAWVRFQESLDQAIGDAPATLAEAEAGARLAFARFQAAAGTDEA
ncbi:MAG: biliverdin-producing heme oxygenase [Caulobacteraceae bacterium]|nr:biliverdin-producing heme oxygenase [Caulobacter sp.]